MVGAQDDVVLERVVPDTHQPRRLLGRLQLVRDHGRDDLAAVGNVRRLQDGELTGRGELRGVAVVEHGQHPVQGEGLAGVDVTDGAVGDLGLDDHRVGNVVLVVLERIAGGAADLLPALDAVDRCPDRAGGSAHSASSVSVRTSVAWARPTL